MRRQVNPRFFTIARRLALSLVALLWLNSCELQRENRPSVLVIAVEGLGFESLSCDSEDASEASPTASHAFCQEAVRFSHAFAPSTMAQATMASLMTGLYPLDHGVRNNGSDFLSAKFKTLAEGALSKGYHTVFVSGGPPIWRKSGLAQGFEVFDDTLELAPGTYYRPAEDVFRIATNWIDQQEGAPFLGVLFLTDLQFPQIATRNDEGEVREKSAEGQLEEVKESLTSMVRWLKNKKRWNNTHIILVGVNSLQRRENDTDPGPLNLKSSSVQVGLFIKPARKEKDNVIQWAVDRSVSLVDVGKTMFEWLGLEPQATSLAELEPQSLAAALTQSEPEWKEYRLLSSESAWPDWLEGSGIRWAIRQNQFLYVDDKRPKIYNTLTDRLEVLPLKSNDPLWQSLNGQVLDLLKKGKIPQWAGMHPHWLEMIEVARELWVNGNASRRPKGGEAWSKWYLRRALQTKDWREVKRLSQEIGEPVGTFVAGRHLGDNIPVPRNPCVRLVLAAKGDKRSFQSECEDERILALHSWQTGKTEEERNQAQERFARLYALQLMDQEIGRLNFLNGLRWDVDRDWPEAPTPLDYVLTLKEMEPYAKKVSGLLSNKDLAF